MQVSGNTNHYHHLLVRRLTHFIICYLMHSNLKSSNFALHYKPCNGPITRDMQSPSHIHTKTSVSLVGSITPR